MTTKTDEQERALLPCPFCGGKVDLVIGFEPFKAAFVDCPTCGVSGRVFEQPQDAAQNWNRRAALQSQDREDAAFLQEDDQHDLHRFIETTEDGQGYDIGKERIKRLAELGVVSNQGFGRYSVTAFGYWAHERYWHQNPSLPLKTIDEYNAEATKNARSRIEGEAK